MLRLRARQSAVRAVDTNIIVRLLTGDDPEQAERAKRVFAGGDIFLGITVILESEWVLRSGYGFSALEVADGLRRIAGLPGVEIEEPFEVARALDAAAGGMDFADALHLARSADCQSFLTFDRKLAKQASKLDYLSVELV